MAIEPKETNEERAARMVWEAEMILAEPRVAAAVQQPLSEAWKTCDQRAWALANPVTAETLDRLAQWLLVVFMEVKTPMPCDDFLRALVRLSSELELWLLPKTGYGEAAKQVGRDSGA